MSSLNSSATDGTQPKPSSDTPERPFHRLAEVRQLQGVSCRTMARRLETNTHEIRQQETATTDLSLSTLYRWQAALDVPITELLVDTNDPLSTPVLKRAQLVRLMKTTQGILQRSTQPGIRRMALVLIEQLIEIMPELKAISPLHSDERLSQEEIADNPSSTNFFLEPTDY